MPRPQPPPGFVTIGPGVYISLAPASATASQHINDSMPNVILIFGWIGALTRHLQNYSRGYAELYPHATQIIVECRVSFFLIPEREKRKRLTGVVEALESLGCFPTIDKLSQESTRPRPRVLVHSFSNGGGYQLTSLGRLLSSKYPSIPLSEYLVSAVIIDSSPSVGTFRTVGLAFSIAIRNPIARYTTLPIIYSVHAFARFRCVVFGVDTLATQYLKALLCPRLLPWMHSQTPRLYVFSRKDELVPWTEIEQHVEAARASGLNVRSDVYEESAHVAHMRVDPNRYWASVQDLWQTACREDEEQAAKVAT